MKYLNYQSDELISRGGFDTAREISSQPELWEKTYLKFKQEEGQILKFLEKVWAGDCPNVILTGAGSSAFIGESLTGSFQKEWKISTKVIATTDIVTHPQNHFIKSQPTLLISFARSGDSPESEATIDLAKKYCDHLFLLNITCNPDGKLAQSTHNENSYVFLLPGETNDRSLAMTSSFSSMLLSGLLIANIRNLSKIDSVIKNLKHHGEYALTEFPTTLKKLADRSFERMVFLGSGPLFGVAHESHLKVQELTDGKIICKFDSFLGFRHGPKAVVNDATVIVYLFSNRTASLRYERDLVQSVNETAAGETSVAIGGPDEDNELQFNFVLNPLKGIENIPEDFLPILHILPAQIIGFYKSMNLGLSPDSPSKRASITRVVQGVKVYHSLEIES